MGKGNQNSILPLDRTPAVHDDLPMLNERALQLFQRSVDLADHLRCRVRSVAGAQLRLRDLMKLKVGDFIDVDMPEQHLVYASEVPAFHAKLGESKGCLALEVTGN